MNINDARRYYDNDSTFANVKSLLKTINKSLDLTPTDYIHPHMYVEKFEELCTKLRTSSVSVLKVKLNTLIGLIKRLNPSASTALRDKINELKAGTVTVEHIEEQTRSWSELLKLFEQEIATNPNRFARIVSVCFKHGYCLTLREIYGTTLCRGNVPNRLNLDTLEWTITDHKQSDVVGDRKFKVTQEFADELRQHLEYTDYLLVYKKSLEPYNTCLLSIVGINEFTNNEVRNSYERWNWNGSGHTKTEAMQYSVDVLGHTAQTAERMFTSSPQLVYTCDPHPLHIENPDKFSVSGKLIVKMARKD